jgi:nucleotide-binding universal stress UspA family protein
VIHLAHVLSPGSTAEETRALHEAAWRELSRLVAGDRPPAALERHVLEGDPAGQLRALCKRVGADLLVVGARRRSSLSRALLGSVAQALLETSEVPVLMVPAREI